jgi:hypothetical protein
MHSMERTAQRFEPLGHQRRRPARQAMGKLQRFQTGQRRNGLETWHTVTYELQRRGLCRGGQGLHQPKPLPEFAQPGQR